jgi:hypothetical protein
MDNLLLGAELYNIACDLVAENCGDIAEIEEKLTSAIALSAPLLHPIASRGVKGTAVRPCGDVDQDAVVYLLSNAKILLGKLVEWNEPSRAQVLYKEAIQADRECVEAYTQLARSTWQLATALHPQDLSEVEKLLRQAISIATAKRTKPDANNEETDDEAKRLLIRLLWQNSHRDDTTRLEEARRIAAAMGYTHILPHAVFDSVTPALRPGRGSPRILMQSVCLYDNALPSCMLNYLLHSFGTASPFWPCHGYDSPTTGFFSYQNDLSATRSNRVTGLNDLGLKSQMCNIVHHIWSIGRNSMPSLARAKYGEWWAHKRYHSNGHKLHYDYVTNPSNPAVPQHPIATCILYLTDDCGGSTFVTDQTVASGEAHTAYLVHPKSNRVACFDGRLLHCVAPASGLPSGPDSRRVTLMFAFYESDPGAPSFEPLFNDPKGQPAPAHHSDSLEWIDYFRDEPLSCKCASHDTCGTVDTSGLVFLNTAVDCIQDDHNHKPFNKRRRECGVNLLNDDQVFMCFEALNSGLVLAKKFI